ncbi:hypothetical protein [Mycobacterium sp. NS-7484]|uniref:hypothetical protein n=1 Tax=Mycobacterium sp. NS-7484 TaxID=1834161 RepID=UPI0011539208|nr:hypothetical protein [Mycobacterium sp. NS-7484]
MSTTRERLDKLTRMAGAAVVTGALGLTAILGSAAVANAAPVTKVGSDPVAPVNPGGKKAPFTKVGSDPVTSVISGIADAATSGGTGVEIPPLVSPWPGGAWAGHDWSKGYPGGGLANGKGGGAAIHGKAGGAWNHRN